MRRTLLLVPLAAALTAASCAGEGGPLRAEGRGEDQQQEAPLEEVALTVTATDFAYRLDADSLPADAPIRLTLVNEGEESHEAVFYRLNDGVSLEAFVTEAEKAAGTSDLPGAARELVTPSGGVAQYIDPGDDHSLILRLQAGRYAVVCHLLDRESLKPHYAMGMIGSLEVV